MSNNSNGQEQHLIVIETRAPPNKICQTVKHCTYSTSTRIHKMVQSAYMSYTRDLRCFRPKSKMTAMVDLKKSRISNIDINKTFLSCTTLLESDII